LINKAKKAVNQESEMMGISGPGLSTVGSVAEMGQWSPPNMKKSKRQIQAEKNSNLEAGLPDNLCTSRELDMYKVARAYTLNSFLFFMSMVCTWVILRTLIILRKIKILTDVSIVTSEYQSMVFIRKA
jgi:hypothetical protein